MNLLLINKVVNPLMEERFKIGDVPFLEQHLCKHYQKNGILLKVHAPGHLRFNVFDYLWLLLIHNGRRVGTPLTLFPTIKTSIDFNEVIFRVLTTKENSLIMINYPTNNVTIGIIENDELLIEQEGRYIYQSLSDTLKSTTLIFHIKDIVNQFIQIMVQQKRVDQLKNLLIFNEEEIQLIRDFNGGYIKTINGVKINKIEDVIDIILSTRDIIEFTTKSGEIKQIKHHRTSSLTKKVIKNSQNPFFLKKSVETIINEFIK